MWQPAFRVCVHVLQEEAPGRLVLVTIQPCVDDGAGGAPYSQLLAGLHMVAQVVEAHFRIHFELLLPKNITKIFYCERTHVDSLFRSLKEDVEEKFQFGLQVHLL